ncbi:unnamed protein product [Urochloa humidicola]
MSLRFFNRKASQLTSQGSRLFPHPLLQLREAKRGRAPFPAAIPPTSSISGRRSGAGDGGGPGNRRADVHRLGRSRSCLPTGVVGEARVRSRVCLSAGVAGGAWCCRGGFPLWLAFRGGVVEATAATACGIMLRLLLAPMVLLSGAIGEFGSFCLGVRAWIFVACQVRWFLPFCFKDAGCAVGDVVGGRLDPARFPLGDAGRRRRGRIQELDGLGRGPGRWATADGFISSSGTGVYFGSFQSQRAMELAQFTVALGVFLGGGS